MKKLTKFTEDHPLNVFYILAILIALIVLPFAIIVFTKYPDFGKDIQTVTDGKGYNTNILYSLPIALKVSGGAWFALILLALPVTTSIAAIITSFILKRKEGIKELFRKFRFWAPELSFKKGLTIWSQAILLIVGINFSYSILLNFVGEVEPIDFLKIHTVYTVWEILFIFISSILFDGGGLMEEVGWRGFALPRLQKIFSPLKSSIILGVMWSLWHIPIKMNISPLSDFISFYFIFTLVCILYCIVITYFYNRLGGSILIGVAIHGLLNDSTGIRTILNSDSLEVHDFTSTALLAVIFMAVVLFILYKEGPMLGKKVEA